MTRRTVRAAFLQTRATASAFTLVEVVLALAIVATAFVALLGLLPAGLNASREAANSTVTATVLEDLNNRLQNRPLPQNSQPVTFTAWFDEHGLYIPVPENVSADPNSASANQLSSALAGHHPLYRATVTVQPKWNTTPQDTSALRPVTIALSWPVDEQTGKAMGADNPKTVVTYAVTTLTGTDWPLIDPAYVPKIEF